MKSFPYNAVISGYDDDGMPIFDRAIDAAEQRKWTSIFYTNGVLADNGAVQNFKVSASTSAMKVLVSPGVCNINGVIGIEANQRELTIEPSEVYDRIDLIVLRLNEVERTLDLAVRKGTAAVVPAAPQLIRPTAGESGDIYEICLAQVFVAKNSTQISGNRITDTRLNNAVCGIITNAINNLNTSSYYTRFENTLAFYEEEIKNWVRSLRNALSENEVASLLNLIDTTNLQYEVIIPKSGWILNANGMYEQTVSNSNSLEYAKRPFWTLADKGINAAQIEAEEKAFACLTRMNFGNGQIQLICKRNVPEVSFSVLVTVAGAELSHNSEALSGILSYDDLLDKPKINSVELSGNKTFADLGIEEIGASEINELLEGSDENE